MRTALGVLLYALFLVLAVGFIWFVLEGVRLLVEFGLLCMTLIAGGLAYG